MSELSQYPMLREEQRIEARQLARRNLMAKLGGEPQYSTFELRIPTRYSPEVERFFYRAMWALLLSAFLLSAIHIFYSARAAYGIGIHNTFWQIAAGLAFVAVAEIAAILFSTAPALYRMGPGMIAVSYGAALVAGMVAIVGNVTVSIAYKGTPFQWVEAWLTSLGTRPMLFMVATVPPVFVLVVGQLQKARILALNERRHQATVDYEQALADWQRQLARLENHPDWMTTWANTLWDVWKHGKRREVLATIDTEQKRALVHREIEADYWAQDVFAQTAANTEPYDKNTVENTPDNTALDRLKIHLADHPEDNELSYRKLADAAGVSINTVQRYRMVRENNGRH